MARNKTPLQLGRPVPIPASPKDAVLDAVANPHVGEDYVVRFTAPEFTTLCPITGQPDFAHFVIDYCPAKSLLESKSLKLFLASFRNTSTFQADCDGNSPKIFAHCRFLVPPRWHSHRCILGKGPRSRECLAAGSGG